MPTDLAADTLAQKVNEGPRLAAKTFFLSDDTSLLMDEESLMRSGLELNVEQGRIRYLGERDSADGQFKTGDQFCLSSQEKDALQALLSKDNVCQGLNPLPEDQMCAMALLHPYAWYGSESQSLTAVGGARCLKAPDIDFCDGQGKKIADLLEQVVQSLDQRHCQTE